MADEGKKVSFGFSKSIKKSTLKVLPQQETKKVDYIECLDEKSIKVFGGEEKKDEPIVIPLLGSKTWHDRILNKTDADIFETKPKSRENGVDLPKTNGNVDSVKNTCLPLDVSQIKMEVCDDSEIGEKSLEEQAAREIIKDLRSEDIKTEDPNLAVPIAENETLRGEAESTLEDYEQIPVDVFGLAMLRGMGWKPGKGIGKNEKVVAASLPELRPKGMGLGADKVTIQKQISQAKTKEEEQLLLEKGAFVKIIAGKHSDNYGEIEGLDDDAGRLIVKLALSGESLSLNEFVVTPVTKSEYAKNSKVLNATKYKEYKNKTNVEEATILRTSESESSDEKQKQREKTTKKKKSIKKSKQSSDSESSEFGHKSRKRRSDDDYEYKSKKSKKSNKKRESSTERSNRKGKKKKNNKERERKTRERKTEYSESLDRPKHKKHKKSRSRSPQKR